MFKQIIVGVDEREGSRDAIALARNLLAPDGDLTLAHIYDGDAHVHRGDRPAYEAARNEHVLELLGKVVQEEDVQANLHSRQAPSAGQGLHELCEIERADLLALGSSERGLLRRVMIGDDTRAALNGAPCAIAIAPAGYRHEPSAMREIGVGYDGSHESVRALELARDLAGESGARLSAFEAITRPPHELKDGSASVLDAVDQLVAEARERIAALGGVEAHAAYGHPAEELTVYSASLDLLVVGSRGYGPVGRLIHGSTSQELARTVRCPLLVLPRSEAPVQPQGDRRDRISLAAAAGS